MYVRKRHNLALIYTQYLCNVKDTSLARLSIRMGHPASWATADVFRPEATVTRGRYQKHLKAIAERLGASYPLMVSLSSPGRQAREIFKRLTAELFKRIQTRRELTAYLKLLLDLRGVSWTDLAKRIRHGNNYFRTGLLRTRPGSAYHRLLANLARVLKQPVGKWTRFDRLPVDPRHRIPLSRRRVYHFLKCCNLADQVSFVQLQGRSMGNLRERLQRGSSRSFQAALIDCSRAYHIPVADLHRVTHGDRRPYQKIRRLALRHVKDRISFEHCLECLARCNHTDFKTLEKRSGQPHLFMYLNANHYRQIRALLTRLQPSLGVSRRYLTRALKRSHIPKALGTNGNYENLMAFVKCYCWIHHTTRKELSMRLFHGDRNKLYELITRDYQALNSDLIQRISLPGVPASDIKRLLAGNLSPLNALVKHQGQRVHDRESLRIYFHCVVDQHHSNYTYLCRCLKRSPNYVSRAVSCDHFEALERLFRQTARILKISPRPLRKALSRSRIPHASRVYLGRRHKPDTRLDMASRRHIEKAVFSLIRKRHLYPTRLSRRLHPDNKAQSYTSTCLLHYSRKSIIDEIARIFKFLKIRPQRIKKVLFQNHMGNYYESLLIKTRRQP